MKIRIVHELDTNEKSIRSWIQVKGKRKWLPVNAPDFKHLDSIGLTGDTLLELSKYTLIRNREEII